MLRRLLCASLLLCVYAIPAHAQSADSFDDFRDRIKSDAISLGGTFRIVPVFGFGEDAARSVAVDQARLSLKGDFASGFGYAIQIDAVNDVPIVDLMLRYQATPGFDIRAGRYKVPFSAEYLRSSSRLDFVSRSRVVNLLAPKRETGISVVLSDPTGLLTLAGGMFNGTTALENDDNAFRYAARAELERAFEAGRFQLATNVSYEREGMGAPVDRWLFGGDARVEAGRLLLAGEAIYGDNPDRAPGGESFGYYATLGYVTGRSQLLARLDALHLGGPGEPGQYLYLIGYNFAPAPMARIQINYVAPAGDDLSPESFEDHGLLLNLQIAF